MQNPLLIDAVTLATETAPPRLEMLGPWLTQPSLGMVYGWRGSGKTWFSMSVAYALASGGDFLGWTAKAPSRVVYVDGEMGRAVIRERQKAICMGSMKDVLSGDLAYTTFDEYGGVIPNLANRSDWYLYDKMIEDAHILIIDNICACIRPIGKQSDADAWAIVQEWSIQKRGKGKSILFVHHSGKSGEQLGTSMREQPMDYVIALKRSSLSRGDKSCCFELHFEKNRHFYGDNAKSLYAKLVQKHAGVGWEYSSLEEKYTDEVLALQVKGLKAHEIAEVLGTTSTRIKQILAEATIGDEIRAERKNYTDPEKDDLF